MTQILGLSGRKQSGKNTTANFLLGLTMNGLALVQKDYVLSDKGELWISDILGDERFAGIFDYYRRNKHIEDLKKNYINPFIKLYSYADLLKQRVCIDVMGLTWKQCYGTDEEKNSPTKYLWENMPSVLTLDKCGFMFSETPMGNNTVDNLEPPITDEAFIAGNFTGFLHWNGLLIHKHGQMTSRDVMQYVGSNIFRKMSGNIWVDALLRQIKQDNSGFAIITDVRFPNEVEGIQKEGGKVMRFTRNPFPEDNHISETALDKTNFNWDNFDWVIDNSKTSIMRQCQLVQEALGTSGWVTDLTGNTDK